MLKETFSMRKIGKHLVNVSMLTLAVSPIVTSALAPVTVLAAEYKSGQSGTNKLEFTTKSASFSENVKQHEAMDLIQIIDLSGSLSDGEYKARNGVYGARKRQINDMIYVIETKLTDQDHVMLAFYGTNKADSYTVGGRDGGVTTKLLSKQDALNLLKKINADQRVHEQSRSWELIPNVVKPLLGTAVAPASDGTGFEDVYNAQPNKNKVVSVLQFTDDWTETESEEIDRSFAKWAKATAKTFMTVVDMSYNHETLSVRQMTGAGHPNIKVFTSLNAANRQEDIATLFESTATVTKTTTTKQQVHATITPEAGVTLKSASLVFADGRTTNLAITGNKVSVDLNELADGKHTINYSFSGDVTTAKKITSSVTVDGKEVDKKEDTIVPLPPAAPAKPAAPKITKRTEKIPFETETKEDATLPEGERKTVQKGVDGEKEYVTTTTQGDNGQEESTTVENILKKAVKEIIHVGTKGSRSEVTEEKVPFKTIREDDSTLAEGTEQVVREGVEGVIQVTTTYETQKGKKVEGSEKVTKKETTAKVDKLIHVGTKGSKSEVTQKKVPFETIREDDPTLEEGKEKVVREGVEGVIKVTTTYETQKGKKVEGSEKVTEEETTAKVDKLIHVGTKGSKSELSEEKVPFETIREDDPTLEEGKEKVAREGVEGVIEVTTTYETQKGQKVEGSEKVTKKEKVAKVDKLIRVGTKGSKSEVSEKKVPFETVRKEDPTLEEGQEKVLQEGVEGVIKVTTTYETQKSQKVEGSEKVTEEKVVDKVDKVIAVGTKGSKSKVIEKKVPFETIYKEDTSLKKGEEKVLQEGVEGVIKVTTTYETQKGEIVKGSEKVTEETVTEKVDKIVAQGTMEKRKVRYRVVDSKGQELVKQTDVMEAYQDEEYKVDTPKLDGYRLELAKDSVPATGKVADRDVLVTFVATKIGKPVTLKFVDESGKEIAQKKVLTGENVDVDTAFEGEAPETIDKDGVKYGFVGIKQTGSKERKFKGVVTEEEQVIEAVYAKPKETPKQLPKTSEQTKQRTAIVVGLLSVVGLGGLAAYFGLRKNEEE